MWISVILIILVIVIGLIAGSRLSAPGPQRRAVNASFISLAVMAGLFFILINAFPGDWIVPFFTVACIVVPICIYVGFTRAAVSKEKASQKKSFEIPRAVTSWDNDEGSSSRETTKASAATPAKSAPKPQSAAPKQKVSAAPVSNAKETAAVKPAPSSKAEEKPQEKKATSTTKKTRSVSAPASSSATEAKPAVNLKPESKDTKASKPVQAAKSEKPLGKAPSAAASPQSPKEDVVAQTPPKQPPAQSAQPVSQATPAPTRPIETESSVSEKIQASLTSKQAEAENQPANSLIAEIEALVERDLNVGRKIAEGASDEEVRAAESAPLHLHDTPLPSALKKPGTSAESSDADDAFKPAPSSTAATAPDAEPSDPFADFCRKANALRDQGSYAVAAIIFNKAAASAPTSKEARTAQFDELSCYVKAGETSKAKALAAQLRQSSVLTRFERIKLDAIERMG